MKHFFLFIICLLLGFIGFLGYKIITTHPNEPIKNIVEKVIQPTFSIANAPSETIKGTISNMSGDIFWESRTATQEAEIEEPVTLQQGETIRTGELGNLNIDFPDETTINMTPKTRLDFVQTLPIDFVINIASGSAQFAKTGENPVTIRALHLLIKQNSGELTVGVDQDNSLVNLNIISGSVIVGFNDQDLISHEKDFNSPQRISFDDLTRKFLP